MNQTRTDASLDEQFAEAKPPKKRRVTPRWNILVRRLHLYAGLFMLPWVFLYGITGAMFNHQGLRWLKKMSASLPRRFVS